MRSRILRTFVIALATAALASAVLAEPADDFKLALAKAEAANKQAGILKNQWTTTTEELKAAQSAAAAGKYDEAIAHARQAEALANASIAQARDQETAWKQAVIH
jgi:hypothetical protein